ncbi:MAG: SUF system Fe-S cluster assembly regulator [Oleibacter sp.]|nr:SUF system Fe-S cluster assembly regulator [Thalassolituus sp.]
MLKLSKLTDYGVLVLSHLVTQGATMQSVDDLCTATGLNPPTIRKVMKSLVDHGLVTARRGVKGGYRIGRSAQQISMLDVVEAFEGPVALTECAQDHNNCDITATCDLADGWDGINQLLMQMMSRITLEDVRNPAIVDKLYRQMVQQSPMIQLVNL